ncbi:radical SAM protein [Carboxydochorda subterranea]|uniref:Radical SAM protein n=1 Tax=Carboxydichorda subterranea TaxID=3109565 RepID=A0ABZ1BZ10_9FIRM|nr:radical SAM protein [Limnochorda sp. L945t]WRP17835.1 radical SAM protein [Limnochorda sp. L945t]
MPTSEPLPRGKVLLRDDPLPRGPWARLESDHAIVGEGSRRLFTFDLEGRLLEAFVDGVGYRRGLDNRFLERRRLPGAPGLSRRLRRHLSAAEARDVVDLACRTAARAREGGYPAVPALDFDALEDDARRFAAVYRPIGILPPDQYLSIVVQLTSGCWYNRCTFCTFYRDRRFEVRSPEALRRHIQEVKAFFGAGLLRRHTVFLGDANALVLPAARLVDALAAVREALDGREVFGFLDAFSGRRKQAPQWAELGEAGLRRVYVGAESGSDGVLRFLDKPGTAADVLANVRAMKEGGIGVGLILLLGAGGRAFAQEHVRQSIALVNAAGLGRGDQLLLSPLVIPQQAPYARLAAQAGIEPLSPAEVRQQAEAILSGVRLGRGARWSYYFVEEFLY